MKKSCSVILLLLIVSLLPVDSLYAQNPGTSADPLVSKSYIDRFFHFRSMVIPSGSTLKLNMGALLIVRSGKAMLKTTKGKMLVDLTAGAEIEGGKILPLNHLILVPDSAIYELAAESLMLLVACGLQPEIKPER